jgi:hypothetical protein
MRKLLFALLAFPASAFADPPSPEDVAKIQYEQDQANADIDKKYGNKKSSEMSSSERKEMMNDKAAAERAVLEKHGVSAKDFSRAQAKQSLDDRAQTREASDKLKKDAEAAKKKDDGKGKGEVVIEKGNGKGTGTPEDDAAEAAAMDKQSGYGKGGGKSGKKSR